MPDTTSPPWSPEQVEALNEYQRAAPMHPFTCPNRDGHIPVLTDRDVGLLTATPSGWICRQCDYRQDWAHAFMADTSWWKK